MAGMACNVYIYILLTILIDLPTHLTGITNIRDLGTDFNRSDDSRISEDNSMISDNSITKLPPTFKTNLNQCFAWNKVNVTAVDYQKNFCPDMCSRETATQKTFYEICPFYDVNCFPCHCTRPQCDIYGTCCPSIHQEKDSSERKHFEQADTVTMCDDVSINQQGFLYIRSCPRNFSDLDVRAKCLDDVPEHEQTIELFSRAYDGVTEVVYYNKYCAECNNISQSIMWTVTIGCLHYQHLYSARTSNELLRLSLKDNVTCEVLQEHPTKFTIDPCETCWHGDVISSCNVTGQWSVPDDDVSSQCENNTDLASIVSRVSGPTPDTYFKNIFCSMCNPLSGTKETFQSLPACRPKTPKPYLGWPKILPFSLLLGSIVDNGKVASEISEINCSISEWAGPDNKCRALECSRGKVFNNRTCTTAINRIKGLAYKARILYIPKLFKATENQTDYPSCHIKNSSQLLKIFVRHFQRQRFFNSVISETNINITMVPKNDLSVLTNLHPTGVVSCDKIHDDSQTISECSLYKEVDYIVNVETYFVAKLSISRDKFENDIQRSLQFNVTDLQETGSSQISFVPMFVPEVPDFITCLDQLYKQNGQFEDDNTNILRNFPISSRNILWTYTNKFLRASPILTCPYISFNQSEYTVSVNCSIFPPTWQVSLNLGHVTISFSDLTDLNRLSVFGEDGSDDGHVKICLDLLEEKMQELKDKHRLCECEKSSVYLWQFYLTQVCLGVSLMCLLITLITFSLFPTLRNNAGTNNMFLSGTLLLAQASLLCSVHVEDPSSLCVAIGISTHFLWLSMTCWSFICCLHMFRVFTAKTVTIQITAISQRISSVKKILASTLTPTVVITTVMLTTYLISGGQRFGYTDKNPCYLDSRLLIVVSLVAPLGIVCVVNLGFFLSTIYKIHKVKKLQAQPSVKKREFETFTIYIKLSTMTGAFWIVSIVSETTNNDPLRFVTIILNGLQGVFLFLSFICNKRVIRFCFRFMSRDKSRSQTLSSSRKGDSGESITDVSSTSPLQVAS